MMSSDQIGTKKKAQEVAETCFGKMVSELLRCFAYIGLFSPPHIPNLTSRVPSIVVDHKFVTTKQNTSLASSFSIIPQPPFSHNNTNRKT
jgi:hypothetical protein